VINTRRALLIAHMAAQAATISNVGLVVDAASPDVQQIAAQLKLGKVVLEMATSDDEWMETAPIGKEQFKFMVFFTALFPALGADETGSDLAAGMHGELYVKLAGSESVWTQGDYALSTSPRGGGAAGTDPQFECVQGFSMFEVEYRHKVGDPTMG